jgi:hypothetical protein
MSFAQKILSMYCIECNTSTIFYIAVVNRYAGDVALTYVAIYTVATYINYTCYCDELINNSNIFLINSSNN